MLVFHCHLSLCIWLKPWNLPCFPGDSESKSQFGGIDKSHWEELLRLVCGVANHESLVTCTNILWSFVLMDWVGDLRSLFVKKVDQFISVYVVTSLDIVADLFNCFSDHLVVVDMGLRVDFPSKYNSVVLCKSFYGAFGIGVLL